MLFSELITFQLQLFVLPTELVNLFLKFLFLSVELGFEGCFTERCINNLFGYFLTGLLELFFHMGKSKTFFSQLLGFACQLLIQQLKLLCHLLGSFALTIEFLLMVLGALLELEDFLPEHIFCCLTAPQLFFQTNNL